MKTYGYDGVWSVAFWGGAYGPRIIRVSYMHTRMGMYAYVVCVYQGEGMRMRAYGVWVCPYGRWLGCRRRMSYGYVWRIPSGREPFPEGYAKHTHTRRIPSTYRYDTVSYGIIPILFLLGGLMLYGDSTEVWCSLETDFRQILSALLSTRIYQDRENISRSREYIMSATEVYENISRSP